MVLVCEVQESTECPEKPGGSSLSISLFNFNSFPIRKSGYLRRGKVQIENIISNKLCVVLLLHGASNALLIIPRGVYTLYF